MARDNDKGLYLPLKINLDEWERDLTAAGEDLRKSMRKMSAEVKDLKMRYEVEISGAEANGDKLKVLQLQTAKLNQLFDIQKRKVDALNTAYQKSVKETGATSAASKQLATTLAKETIEMNKLQKQVNSLGEGIGAKISDTIASISPAFSQARSVIRETTTLIGQMAVTSKGTAVALTGLATTLGTLYVGYKGLEYITNGIHDITKAASDAADPIYQLRERLNSTYEDAEYLARVTELDGSSAEALAGFLEKLNRTLDSDKNGTTLAAQAVERYGIQLKDATGKAKSYKDQLQEMARALQLAAKNKETFNFYEAFKGVDQFAHLLSDLDGYNARAVATTANTKKMYDELHEYGERLKGYAMAQKELDMIKGGFTVKAAIENLKNEMDYLKAEQIILEKNAELYGTMGTELGILANEFTKMKAVASIAWESVKRGIVGAIKDIKTLIEYIPLVAAAQALLEKSGAATYIREKIAAYTDEIDKQKLLIQLERERAEEEAKNKAKNQNLGTINTEAEKEKEKAKKEQEELKKREEAYKKFNEELFMSTATEYEKEIYLLEKKRKAYIDEKIAEVDANQLYENEKAKIDAKYYEKAEAERKRVTEATIKEYQKAAEEQKRLQEASIRDAESTLKSNVQLIRKMQKEMAKGGDWEARVQAWQDRRYMKQNGFKQSDITALQSFGVDFVKKMADSTSRLFGQFANPQQQQQQVPQQVTNNNTINIDRPIVTDESLINQLADKVADKLRPLFAGKTAAGNSF